MADNPDLGLGVAFYIKAVENPRKSKAEGRPIYDQKEYVQIRFPADNKRELHAPAHELHYVPHFGRQVTYAERFPEVYKAFKDDDAAFVNGTPLAELPSINEAQRAELKAQRIHTVEQLAQLPDNLIKRMGMGARDMVEAAQAYLTTAKDVSEIAAMRRELEDLRRQVAGKSEPAVNQYDGLDDEDLRNALADAGVEVDGRWGRKRLVQEIESLAAKKTEAA